MSNRTFDADQAHPLIIAEVAQSHDGSLGLAHAFVDAVADAGADAIKFQTHIAAEESTLDEPFRVRFSRADESRYDYWRRTEFTQAQWSELAEHARGRGLHFLSSPFSVRAVEILADIGVPAWKIGSGELRSFDLLDSVSRAGGPIMLSTGMSPWSEIDSAVSYLHDRGAHVIVLQCTSKYPTELESVGLNVLSEIRERYGCPVGLSDHSGTVFPSLAALAHCAVVIEVHVTLDRRMFGPDIAVSLDMNELAMLVQARNAFTRMAANPVDKDAMADELSPLRDMFGRSVAPTGPISAGTTIRREMLTLRKPATGISADEMGKLVGRRLRRDVSPDRLLTWEDLDDDS